MSSSVILDALVVDMLCGQTDKQTHKRRRG